MTYDDGYAVVFKPSEFFRSLMLFEEESVTKAAEEEKSAESKAEIDEKNEEDVVATYEFGDEYDYGAKTSQNIFTPEYISVPNVNYVVPSAPLLSHKNSHFVLNEFYVPEPAFYFPDISSLFNAVSITSHNAGLLLMNRKPDKSMLEGKDYPINGMAYVGNGLNNDYFYKHLGSISRVKKERIIFAY